MGKRNKLKARLGFKTRPAVSTDRVAEASALLSHNLQATPSNVGSLFDTTVTTTNTSALPTDISLQDIRISTCEHVSELESITSNAEDNSPATHETTAASLSNLENILPEDSPSPTPTQPHDLWTAAFHALPELDQAAFQSLEPMFNNEQPWSEKMDVLIVQTRRKQVECEDKFWKFKFLGREIILRDVAEKVISFLAKFKEVGDVAVQFDPIHAALPWAGMRFLLQAAVGERDQMGDLLISVEKVTHLICRCAIYEMLYNTRTVELQVLEAFQQSLLELYTATLHLLAHSYRMFGKGTVTRGMHALFDPGELPKLLSACDSLEETVEKAVHNCERMRSQQADSSIQCMLENMNTPLLRTDDRVSQLLEKVDERERLKILDWASTVLYGTHHNSVSGERTEGTCEWLLHRPSYQQWKSSSSSDIVWLHGTAGTGKTYLTSKVIDTIRNDLRNGVNQEGFAYFYCNRNEGDRQDPLLILRCFVRQLSVLSSKTEFVMKKLRSHFVEGRNNNSELTIDLCKTIIMQYINSYPKTTLILDALDECVKDKRHVLVNFFDHLVRDSSRPVKIFISSRPDGDIREIFRSPSNIEIRADHNQDDISKYITSEIIRHRKWTKMSSQLQEDIVKTLQNQSQGMFQWAFLQIKELLNLKQEESIRNELGKLPKDLKTAYDDICRRIPPYERRFANRAFQWVMVAGEPLTTKCLLEAVCQDGDENEMRPVRDLDEDLLLEYCHNLLVIDPERGVWIPSHLSVIEYLESHLFSPFDGNYHVSSVCLVLLNNPGYYEKSFSGRFHSPDEAERSEEDILLTSIWDLGQPEINSLTSYVFTYWLCHVTFCERNWKGLTEKPRLPHLLQTFLGSPVESSSAYIIWSRYCVHRYSSLLRSLHSAGDYVRLEEIQPASPSIFGICAFGIFNLVSEWWDHPWANELPRNDKGHSLLFVAAVAGCLPICERLLEWGADMDELLSNGKTALLGSINYRRFHMSAFLIRAGADVNIQLCYDGLDCGSVLIAAIYYKDEKLIKLLLNAGAEINMQVSYGFRGSALVAATFRPDGDNSIVKLLIDSGAEVNMQVKHGDYGSALVAAASPNFDEEAMKLLIKSGAEVNMQVENGKFGSALCGAVVYGADALAMLLIEHGADVNLHLENGLFTSAAEGAHFVYTNKVWKSQLKNERAGLALKMLYEHGAKELAPAKIGDAPDIDEKVKLLRSDWVTDDWSDSSSEGSVE